MATRLRFALLFPFLLILPPVAIAQTAAPQTPDAGAPSESHIAAALDLLKANHSSENIQSMLDLLAPIQAQQIKRDAPQLSDAEVAAVIKNLRDAITARQDEMMRIYALEYSRQFDEQELKDLAAFYRSDLGQKYIVAVPVLMKESSPVIIQWMMGVAAQVRDDLLKSMQNRPDKKT